MSRISLCDTRTGASTHSLVGHKTGCTSLKWDPRNEFQLASGGIDHTIKLWDIRKSGPLHSFDRNKNKISTQAKYAHIVHETELPYAHLANLVSLQFTKSGLNLLSLSSDMEMILWDMTDYTNCIVKYYTKLFKKCSFNQMAISPDESVVAIGLGMDCIAIYDLFSGKLTSEILENYGGIKDLAFHPFIEVILLIYL